MTRNRPWAAPCILVAICRNCGAETARADLSKPPEGIGWWDEKTGEPWSGWSFDLKPCCHDTLANPCIDIRFKEAHE